MWRSSDGMNNSCLEDTECDSSEIINSSYDDIKNSDCLDISLYENTTTETSICNIDHSLQLHSLDNYPSCSKDSGYSTNEYLNVYGDKKGDFCDYISSNELNESKSEEIFSICEIKKPSIQFVLPMDFNILINEDLAPDAVHPKGTITTPKLNLYKKINHNKRSLCNNTEDMSIERQLKTVKTIFDSDLTTTHSENIKMALQRSTTEPNLTGDFSKACYLPLVSGRHQDLKSITASTMALLVRGEFSEDIIFKIIDCRYPYEYDGGHIEGAVNLYTKDMLIDALLNKSALKDTKSKNNKRHILIFHCEFSSNRAPTLYRFLRNFDRNYNEHLYPTLFYPEVYLLEGGYKDFYLNYSNLCLPKDYVPMNDPKFNKDLSYFREKTKSNADQFSKGSNKRLNFV